MDLVTKSEQRLALANLVVYWTKKKKKNRESTDKNNVKSIDNILEQRSGFSFHWQRSKAAFVKTRRINCEKQWSLVQ